jgi:hypothetical protein
VRRRGALPRTVDSELRYTATPEDLCSSTYASAPATFASGSIFASDSGNSSHLCPVGGLSLPTLNVGSAMTGIDLWIPW